MANNYESGATCVPADCFAPGGAEAAVLINGELQNILDSDDRPEEFDDFYIGGLDLEISGDGSLYVSSGCEYFCLPSFEHLVEKLAERKLILKSFGLSVAFFCDKLRADEHGGFYCRALPSGEVLVISTQLDDLTDEQLRRLTQYRGRPDAFTFAELSSMTNSKPGAGLTEALDLEDHFGHWGEHPDHPVADWQAEVSNDETRLGYWYWVEGKLQDFPEDDT